MSKTITPWGKQCKVQMMLQDLTLKELSATVGLSHTYVSAIINGRTVAPQETVERINEALGLNKVPAN